MPPFRNESADPFQRVATQAREAINAARDTQESARSTRRRVRLHGLIMSWRNRRAESKGVQAERLALVLDVVRDEAEAPMGNIQLVESGALCIRSSCGLSESFLKHFAQVVEGQCCCGRAFETAAAVVVNNVRDSALFAARDREMLLASGIHACQSLALKQGNRRLGVISLHYRDVDIPTRRQIDFQNLAGEIAEAVSLALVD